MSTTRNAAILFEPDGYILDGPKLMGRQAAGNAFLRAAVEALKGETLWGCTPSRASAEAFSKLVREIDPQADPQWLRAGRLDLLARVGTLYEPHPGLGHSARLRLRAGVNAFSLVGVTHTTASHRVMDSIAELLSAPVMPWDAVICTSEAVVATVRDVLKAEADYLRWRFGAQRVTAPQLPVIPLGVHTGDFEFGADERQRARRDLAIADDEVVALFVGRLSFHAKAHPHALYVGLQKAAETTGQRLVLLQCGWFATPGIERAFKNGAAAFCPSVRALFADGRVPDQLRRSWAAADLFVSLSDNIQETFGLTPVEAMAAGLPVVVTDWNGYKETVRDGVDGFRIPTWMPPAGSGSRFAAAYEAGVDTYDYYCGRTCQLVSVDVRVLVERLADLVTNAGLRRTLGGNGRARARELYDWSVVFARYQALWGELAAIRADGRADAAGPRAHPTRMDPFRLFRTYPTRRVGPATLVCRVDEAPAKGFDRLAADPLFSWGGPALPGRESADGVLGAVADGAVSCEAIATATGLTVAVVMRTAAALAKMGLVRLDDG